MADEKTQKVTQPGVAIHVGAREEYPPQENVVADGEEAKKGAPAPRKDDK